MRNIQDNLKSKPCDVIIVRKANVVQLFNQDGTFITDVDKQCSDSMIRRALKHEFDYYWQHHNQD
ncbi:hypothetical protein [Photobacterium leiognathi]|uniref:hypothetical protein n=1 Tax=Photobacterium leiognathi TaxID=553611 RepID=UPI002981EE42|nr:hypothetical protein [Photobacterium leiognathi]